MEALNLAPPAQIEDGYVKSRLTAELEGEMVNTEGEINEEGIKERDRQSELDRRESRETDAINKM